VRRVRHSLRRVVLPLISALSIAVALSPLLIAPPASWPQSAWQHRCPVP
jgi:hypothetical protein